MRKLALGLAIGLFSIGPTSGQGEVQRCSHLRPLTETLLSREVSLRYPDNWQIERRIVDQQGFGDTWITPPGGVIVSPDGVGLDCGIVLIYAAGQNLEKLVQSELAFTPRTYTEIPGTERAFILEGRKAIQLDWTTINGQRRGTDLYVDDPRGVWFVELVAPSTAYELFSTRLRFSEIIESIHFRPL